MWDAAAVQVCGDLGSKARSAAYWNCQVRALWAVGPRRSAGPVRPNVRWRVENPDKIRCVAPNIGDDIAK